MKRTAAKCILSLALVSMVQGQSTPANEALWEAARAGDTARITTALAQGADVNAKARYDVTALFFAASSGRLDAVKLLVARGANVTAADSFYKATAAEMAATNGHTAVVLYLVQNGASADSVLAFALQSNDEALVKAAVAGKITRQGLQQGMTLATALNRPAFAPIIKEALDKLPAEPAPPVFAVDAARLPRYAGNYRDAASGLAMAVTVQNGRLMGQVQGGPLVGLVPSAENVFRVVEVNATLTFNERGGVVESMTLVQG